MPAAEKFGIGQQSADERRRARAAARTIVDGVARENIELFLDGLAQLEHSAFSSSGWRRIVSAIAKLPPVNDQFRAAMMVLWMSEGDSLRSAIRNDSILLDFLRLLLPAYAGPDLHLYRSESAQNRRRGTYGLSWTDEMAVARQLAENRRGEHPGGTLVVESQVPASAIICAPATAKRTKVEREYLVDCRRLGPVRIIARLR